MLMITILTTKSTKGKRSKLKEKTTMKMTVKVMRWRLRKMKSWMIMKVKNTTRMNMAMMKTPCMRFLRMYCVS